MNGVAAEITQKIPMLFKHTNIHARPGQQKAQHHACWSSSGNATSSLDGFAHSRDFASFQISAMFGNSGDSGVVGLFLKRPITDSGNLFLISVICVDQW